jgi:hypothetical protein
MNPNNVLRDKGFSEMAKPQGPVVTPGLETNPEFSQ